MENIERLSKPLSKLSLCGYIHRLRASGLSLRAIADALKAERDPKFNEEIYPATIQRILSSGNIPDSMCVWFDIPHGKKENKQASRDGLIKDGLIEMLTSLGILTQPIADSIVHLRQSAQKTVWDQPWGDQWTDLEMFRTLLCVGISQYSAPCDYNIDDVEWTIELLMKRFGISKERAELAMDRMQDKHNEKRVYAVSACPVDVAILPYVSRTYEGWRAAKHPMNLDFALSRHEWASRLRYDATQDIVEFRPYVTSPRWVRFDKAEAHEIQTVLSSIYGTTWSTEAVFYRCVLIARRAVGYA